MPPSSNTQKAANSDAAALRKFPLYSFAPGFILFLVHGLASGQPFPALGLMPMAASAIVSGLVLFRDKFAASGSPIQNLSPSNIFFADAALALFHFAMLIPSWVFLTAPWHEPHIALGAYCTVFMMVDVYVHCHFTFTHLVHLIVSRNCDCEHCRSMSKFHLPTIMASEYTPLNDAESEAEDIGRDLEEGAVRI